MAKDNQPKGNTTARGYGAEHQKLRRRIAPLVAAGQAICWRCGQKIPAGSSWDLGHDDHDRSRYRGPEHVKCNRATSARNGKPVIRADKSRDW